jgi:uncharacterized protein DUF1707
MPEPHLRAADADRSAVADLLGRHMATGRLTVAEYDERLARAYAARTYGELAELTADLPPERSREPVPAAQPVPQPVGCAGPGGVPGWGPWSGTRALRAAWMSWLGTALVVVSIWVATVIVSTSWIPFWPIWVIGPWGAVLLVRTLGGGGAHGRDRQRHRRPERQNG